MSDMLVRPVGSGSGGAYVTNDRFTLDDANQMRIYLNKLGKGGLQRNIWAGGLKSDAFGIPVSADADVDLWEWVPLLIPNASTELSGFTDSNGASLVAQFRFEVRVSDAAISATPKLRYGTTYGGVTSVATISGAAACSATNSDYSGTNQYQTVTVTLPSGANYFKPQLTVASTGGNPYTVWGRAFLDLYVSS